MKCLNRIKKEIRYYYKKLFRQNKVTHLKFQEGFVNQMYVEEANSLEEFLSMKEINSTVWSCEPSKAPGVDGFNLNFIRRSWYKTGKDFSKQWEISSLIGKMPKEFNMT